MEYEVELIVKRYEGSRHVEPEPKEIFYGRKVLNPAWDNIFDQLDDFKFPADEKIAEDASNFDTGENDYSSEDDFIDDRAKALIRGEEW